MSERYEGQTFYEILEVQPSAGPAEIYAAYQRARSTYSPSSPALYSMFSPQEAQELMALIEEAYQTLSHQARRREYDTKIGLSKGNASSAAKASGASSHPGGSHASPSSNHNSRPSAAGTAPSPVAHTRMTTAEATASAASSAAAVTAERTKGDQWVGTVKVSTRKDESLPTGFARTKFTVYEVKPEIEQEIEAITEIDGLFLQKIRLYKGVTLDHMSDEIRVIKSTLVALEANDIDALPVAVFTRGFVVQFARALGLNERKISEAYMKFFKAKKT